MLPAFRLTDDVTIVKSRTANDAFKDNILSNDSSDYYLFIYLFDTAESVFCGPANLVLMLSVMGSPCS